MMNVFVLGCVGLAFGIGNLFGGQGRDTELLILVGLVLVAMALVFGVAGDVKLGPTSLGTALILAAYIVGMRMVYKAGQTHMHLQDIPAPTGSAKKAWIGFGISVVVVIIAGRFLAASADRIAEISGISASFIGVLLVSIVTTLPEGSVTVAATLRKSYGIAMGNVYGSNAFNVTILTFSDLFSAKPLLGKMEGAHYAAAIAAFVLMAMGYLVWKAVQNPAFAKARILAPVIPIVYIGALYVVYTLAQT
jgi:cation:H+ antiporter